MAEKLNRNSSTLSKIVGLSIAVIIFFFLGKQLYQNWHQLSQYELKLNGLFIFISFLVLSASYLLSVASLKISFSAVGERVSFKNIFRITCLSEMGKYIPGKIWSITGYIYLANRLGFSKTKILVSRVLFLAIRITAGIILFSIINLFYPIMPFFLKDILPIILIIVSGLILLHPVIFERLLKFFLTKILKTDIKLKLKYKYLIKLLFLSILIWLIYGIWFFVFTNAIYPISITNLWPLTAIFFLSWFSGFLVFIVPSGLGVREGVMTMLLKPLMPLPVAIVIPIFLRLAAIIADLMMFFIAMSFKKNE